METFDVLNRSWVMGSDGDIYHYNFFDPRQRRFTGLWIYEFNADMTRLTARTFAAAGRVRRSDATWQVERGLDARVRRQRRAERSSRRSNRAQGRSSRRDSSRPKSPDPDFMSYTQLRAYTERLRASGLDVVKQQVALCAEALVSVRHAHHDAARRPVRGDDRAQRRDGRHRRRHRHCHRLLDDDQCVCGDGSRRRDGASAGGVGAEPAVRRWRVVLAAHRHARRRSRVSVPTFTSSSHNCPLHARPRVDRIDDEEHIADVGEHRTSRRCRLERPHVVERHADRRAASRRR